MAGLFWKQEEGVDELLSKVHVMDLKTGKDLTEISESVRPKIATLLSEENTKSQMFEYISKRFADSLRGVYNGGDIYWADDFGKHVFLPMLAPQLQHLYEGEQKVMFKIRCTSSKNDGVVDGLELKVCNQVITERPEKSNIVPYFNDTYNIDSAMNIVSWERWYWYTSGPYNYPKSQDKFPISLQDGSVEPFLMYKYSGKNN